MIEIILKGVIMGVAVAAPVGPIGVLCINRTLEKGKLSGLMTGLGTAVADGIFGLLVAFGVGLSAFLREGGAGASGLKLLGGVFLFYLGAKSLQNYKKKKIDLEAPAGQSKVGYVKDFASSLALTMANPMTIMVFFGFVAALGLNQLETDWAVYVFVAGIFIGSVLWWVFLIFSVSVLKTRLSTNLLLSLDLISGGLLVLWGLYACFEALQNFSYHEMLLIK